MPLRPDKRLLASFKAVFTGEADSRHMVDVFLVVAALAVIAYVLFGYLFNKG